MKVNLLAKLDITQQPPVMTGALITTATPGTMTIAIGKEHYATIWTSEYKSYQDGHSHITEMIKNHSIFAWVKPFIPTRP